MLYCDAYHLDGLRRLLAAYQISITEVAEDAVIPGSFWGDSEAGVIGAMLYVRSDTPVHSALHEACHIICMDEARRAQLHTDAGGDDLEEAAVCLLQILLADQLPEVGQAAIMADMDTWGYSFRLGSTQAWLEHDSADAWVWLRSQHLINAAGQPQPRPKQPE